MMRQTRNRLPPSLPTRPLINVHVYDTHLSSVYDHKSEEKISRADKNQLFTDLNTKLSRPAAKQMVDIISNDMKNADDTGRQSLNYDPSNNINCTDVLASILIKSNNTDLISLLDEQLEDMYNLGRCPQGRSTRLLQLYVLV